MQVENEREREKREEEHATLQYVVWMTSGVVEEKLVAVETLGKVLMKA